MFHQVVRGLRDFLRTIVVLRLLGSVAALVVVTLCGFEDCRLLCVAKRVVWVTLGIVIRLLLRYLRLFQDALRVAFGFNDLLRDFRGFLALLIVFRVDLLRRYLGIVVVDIHGLRLFELCSDEVFRTMLDYVVRCRVVPGRVGRSVQRLFLFSDGVQRRPTSITRFASNDHVRRFHRAVEGDACASIFVPIFVIGDLRATST